MTIPAGYGQVTYHHTGPGVTGSADCVIGFNPTTSSLEDAEAVRDQWQNFMLTNMNNDVSFTGATVRFGQDGADDLLYELGPNGLLPTVGAYSEAMMPLNNCILVAKISGLSGRRNRGRIYLPGATEILYDAAGRMGAGDLAVIQENCDNYVTNMELIPAPLVLLHTRPPFVPTPVPTLLVRDLVATQRMRIR